LLILDEATEGLAPLVALEIWMIVREICSSHARSAAPTWRP